MMWSPGVALELNSKNKPLIGVLPAICEPSSESLVLGISNHFHQRRLWLPYPAVLIASSFK